MLFCESLGMCSPPIILKGIWVSPGLSNHRQINCYKHLYSNHCTHTHKEKECVGWRRWHLNLVKEPTIHSPLVYCCLSRPTVSESDLLHVTISPQSGHSNELWAYLKLILIVICTDLISPGLLCSLQSQCLILHGHN